MPIQFKNVNGLAWGVLSTLCFMSVAHAAAVDMQRAAPISADFDQVAPDAPPPIDVRQWRLDQDGNIHDGKGVRVGRVEGDGAVVAPDGTTVGHINRDNFTGAGGQVRGTLTEDGGIHNDMGSIVAWVSPHDRIMSAFILFSPDLLAHQKR